MIGKKKFCSVCHSYIHVVKNVLFQGESLENSANHAFPINDEICCDWCYFNKVIPLRLELLDEIEFKNMIINDFDCVWIQYMHTYPFTYVDSSESEYDPDEIIEIIDSD
tara:strand:+ start:1337 stop:1663 length:327 start_codon:yes stop_codon:yes gene_type:complete